jgi:protein gp37
MNAFVFLENFMAQNSNISWTHNTFNPWMGCDKVSPGCANCYAATMTKNRMGLNVWGKNATRQVTSAANWKLPLKWNREAEEAGERTRVFCGSLCDVMEDHPVPNATRPRLFELIRSTPWLDWLLLTKRPERYATELPTDWGYGYANVWLGTSIETNDYVWRADLLRKIPATVRFISYEPALGPLDQLDLTGIDWLIQGGESGANFRPMNIQWAHDMEAQCKAAGTSYFFKQSAAFLPGKGSTLGGQIVHNYPARRLALPVLTIQSPPPTKTQIVTIP